MKRRNLALLIALNIAAAVLNSQAPVHEISIDAHARGHAFPHFWEKTFGSGRAILALRDNYRQDLKDVHDSVGMRYVRFHAILHDEVGVYDEDEAGKAVYNFTYVDQIYDGLLDRGVRPFVEISFMPYKLASDPKAIHPFWYKQNVSPPKDYAKWDALMSAFAQHLVDRYGIDEVAQWYFEVWNEPNIDFWAGEPKQSTYFELYDHTARALKAVNPRLRMGGPSSSSAHWVPEFLKHVNEQHVPVDFVSSHGYADDTVEDLFGSSDPVPMKDRLCKAIGKVHAQIASSASPALPLMWTEWNVPSYGDLGARDNWYVGPALARDISQCDGLVNMMSFWTFDDVFEEGGVKQKPFDNGFGLIAPGMIKKPSFYDFALLHKLGEERIANPAEDVLVTRRNDGTLVVAAWNLVDVDKVAEGKPINVRLKFAGVAADAKVAIERVDETHGNPLRAYASMGSPTYPTQKQVAEMNSASALPAPERTTLKNGQLELTLPVNGLAVIEIQGNSK
ncbi:MAG: glycosyl hydrolase family 39 [Acidobacteria bacterium]|nr:glycosyl hydrolase family 39 [Acidobacteriota bacterium]